MRPRYSTDTQLAMTLSSAIPIGTPAISDSPVIRSPRSYDLDLFVDTEPIVAGMAAACHTGGAGSGEGSGSDNGPEPEAVAGFLETYDSGRPDRFTGEQQQQPQPQRRGRLPITGAVQ
jgi:hypothetical protein